MLAKETLIHQLNEVLMNQDEDNVPSRRLTDLKQTKREKETEEMPLKIKEKLEWRPEDCAQPLGNMTSCTGEGVKKKCHYKTFMIHGKEYALEDSVLLAPAKENKKPYVAILKDIYIQGKEGHLKLEVEWFYRPDDIAKKYLGNWEPKDSRDLFYSFHRDEVFAEFVMHKCLVYFVPENKKLLNRKEHPGFVVQKVYDHVKKKLMEFTYQGLDMQQKDEIDRLVRKTISRVRDLPDLDKAQMAKISRRKTYVPKKFILKAPIRESITKIGEASRTSSNDFDREKILEELLEAVKHMSFTSQEKQACYCDFIWPNDVDPVMRALEQTLYGSLGEDIRKYNYKVKILVDQLKNSHVFGRRLLNGELKPEQAIKMTGYELKRGFTFEELILEEDVASTS